MDASITDRDALVVVDVQNDFCPGGALAVPGGDKVVPVLNTYIEVFERAGAPVVATRDWHPEDHVSFQAQGGPWPPHCVKETKGADYHPALDLPEGVKHVKKATEPDAEAYSGFDGTDLAAWLEREGVDRILVGGLATDYCVKQTVLDGLAQGFNVLLLVDAIEGIDAQKGEVEAAVLEMVAAGAKRVTFEDLEA